MKMDAITVTDEQVEAAVNALRRLRRDPRADWILEDGYWRRAFVFGAVQLAEELGIEHRALTSFLLDTLTSTMFASQTSLNIALRQAHDGDPQPLVDLSLHVVKLSEALAAAARGVHRLALDALADQRRPETPECDLRAADLARFVEELRECLGPPSKL
jgi:hypothetical protein